MEFSISEVIKFNTSLTLIFGKPNHINGNYNQINNKIYLQLTNRL